MTSPCILNKARLGRSSIGYKVMGRSIRIERCDNTIFDNVNTHFVDDKYCTATRVVWKGANYSGALNTQHFLSDVFRSLFVRISHFDCIL